MRLSGGWNLESDECRTVNLHLTARSVKQHFLGGGG